MSVVTNEDLLRRYQHAEAAAFDQFYKRTQGLVLPFLMVRLRNLPDAEEAFQETYLRVHRSIMGYDPKQSALAWLFTIARNAAVDVVRRRRRYPSEQGEAGLSLTTAGTAADLVIEARQTLQEALTQLSAADQELLMRRFLKGDALSDVAQHLGLTETNTRQRLSRILKKIRTGSAD